MLILLESDEEQATDEADMSDSASSAEVQLDDVDSDRSSVSTKRGRGRPKGSKNKAGHKAGGRRERCGRKRKENP